LVEKIERLLDAQGLKVSVKSGKPFGEEDEDNWVILTLTLQPPVISPPPLIPTAWPSSEWFEVTQTRIFESEREVETYFVTPLLEKLGYEYDDIVMGHGVEIFRGVQRTRTEADFVTFKGPGRNKKDVLLVIEVKKSDQGISIDNISQTKSYAQELLPACYLVVTGQQIKVFLFNGFLVPDECVMDFSRLELKQEWDELYNYVSKQSTIKRKLWMEEQISKVKGK
jgi:hypothetical protein